MLSSSSNLKASICEKSSVSPQAKQRGNTLPKDPNFQNVMLQLKKRLRSNTQQDSFLSKINMQV